MEKWLPKNNIVNFAIIAVLISILLYFTGLFIVYKETKKAENLYTDTESEFFKGKKFWAIQSLVEKNSETIQLLRSFFVQKGDEINFIEQIENVAKGSGVKFDISSIEVKEDAENSFEEDVFVKMEIEGSWKNVMAYVENIERMPFGVSVVDITLDAQSPGNWSGSIQFVLFREK
jgi:Tfp pilus assembly protein PilO